MMPDLKNPRWRVNHLYKIVTKDGNLEVFKENKIQAFINGNDSQRKKILKARQFGVSTNELIKKLDQTIFNRNQTTCILAHEQDSLNKLFRIVRRAYEYMPDTFKPELDRGGGSAHMMYFPRINSRIYCDLESRSDTIHNLHISEMAFCKDQQRINATLQAVPKTGNVSIETTPNGMNFFRDFYFDSPSYKKFFFPWYLHDEYKLPTKGLIYSEEEITLVAYVQREFGFSLTDSQIAWRRWKIEELKGVFKQEYPENENDCFLASGSPIFELEVVSKMLMEAKDYTPNGFVTIFKPFDKAMSYFCGVDCAEGVGGDYSVAHIYNQNFEHCASIRGQIKPSDFAKLIAEVCLQYRVGDNPPPIICVERNNHGHAVLLELYEHLQYPYLYVGKDEKLGWKTDSISRPIMINALDDAIRNRVLKSEDKVFLNECMTFVNNEGKPEAVDGKHDDCIFATGLAVQMIIERKSLAVYNDLKEAIYL